MGQISTWWQQGGVVMWPLAIYSFFGLAVLIEKIFFLKKISDGGVETARQAAVDVLAGKPKPPDGDSPAHAILRRLFDMHNAGLGAEALVRTAEREVSRLEDISMRGMIWLAIIGNTGPFIGLFGTVIGIIRAFQGLSAEGLLTDPSANPELISGIAEALVATATGLLVAVPAVICYNFLLREIRSRMTRLELACNDYADALGNRENGK